MKTLSIITVTFNSEKTLMRTIESIVSQKTEEIEFIVIDGKSTDKTVELIQASSSSIDYWVSEKDRGIFDAMAKGVEKASGKYIAFMNSNDWYQDGVLKTVVATLRESEEDMIYGDTEVFLNDVSAGTMVAGKISGNDVLHMPFCHQSSFIKKATFERLKGFNPDYKYSADYELLLRVLKDGGSLKKIPRTIAAYSLGGVSSDFKRASRERMKIQKAHGLSAQKILKAYISWNITGTIRTLIGEKNELRLRKWLNKK